MFHFGSISGATIVKDSTFVKKGVQQLLGKVGVAPWTVVGSICKPLISHALGEGTANLVAWFCSWLVGS
jgi:hypothetical protein